MNNQNELEQKALTITDQVKVLKIKDQQGMDFANSLLTGVKLLIKEIGNTFDDIVKKADETHKIAVAKRKNFLVPARQNEAAIKNEMARFHTEQELIRKKEEDRLRKISEEKERKLQEKAKEALKAGDETKAEKLQEKAAEVVVRTVAPKFDKPKNVSFTMRYKGIIEDEKKIPRILNGVVLMIPDTKTIDRLAQSSKGMVKIPGVRIVAEKHVTGRQA